MRWLTRTLIIAAVPMISFGGGARADEFAFDYQKIIDVSQPVKLDLYSVKGNVTVTGGADNQVIIEAVKKVRGDSEEEAEEVADHIEIKVNSGGDRVKIETHYLKIVNRSRTFWSKILGAGGEDSYGDVDFNITVPANTSVSLMCLNGDVIVSSVEGEVIVENEAGSTRGEYIFGPVTLVQPVGEIELNWIEGDIKLNSTSSDISIIQVRGAIDLTTSAGTVHVQTELDSPDDYFVETSSGSITFSVPVSSSGRLDIETEGGEIRTEVPVTIESVTRKRLVGTFGLGGPKISLTSGTGDVDVALY